MLDKKLMKALGLVSLFMFIFAFAFTVSPTPAKADIDLCCAIWCETNPSLWECLGYRAPNGQCISGPNLHCPWECRTCPPL